MGDSNRTPEWVCPRTLRWVASQIDDDQYRAVEMAEQCRRPDRDGVRSIPLHRYAEKWDGIADSLRGLSRRLRNRATRQENRA